MGMMLESLGHIWPVYGNGMERLDDVSNYSHFKMNFFTYEKVFCHYLKLVHATVVYQQIYLSQKS